jgi:hypothetical protein
VILDHGILSIVSIRFDQTSQNAFTPARILHCAQRQDLIFLGKELGLPVNVISNPSK